MDTCACMSYQPRSMDVTAIKFKSVMCVFWYVPGEYLLFMLTTEVPENMLTPYLLSLLTDVSLQVAIGDKASPESIKAALLQKVGCRDYVRFERRPCRACWGVLVTATQSKLLVVSSVFLSFWRCTSGRTVMQLSCRVRR